MLFYFLCLLLNLDDGGHNSQNRMHGNNSNYQQNRQMGFQQNNFNNYSNYGSQGHHGGQQSYHQRQSNQSQQQQSQQQTQFQHTNNRGNRFQPYQQRSNQQNFGQNSGGFNRNQPSNRGGYWR